MNGSGFLLCKILFCTIAEACLRAELHGKGTVDHVSASILIFIGGRALLSRPGRFRFEVRKSIKFWFYGIPKRFQNTLLGNHGIFVKKSYDRKRTVCTRPDQTMFVIDSLGWAANTSSLSPSVTIVQAAGFRNVGFF